MLMNNDSNTLRGMRFRFQDFILWNLKKCDVTAEPTERANIP